MDGAVLQYRSNLDPLVAFDHLQVNNAAAIKNRQVHCFTGLQCQLLQIRIRPVLEIQVAS
jgi:hypothetical protein